MAKEAAILRSEVFPVAEQAIGLGLESLEVIEGYFSGGIGRGPCSLPLVQERIRRAGIRAAVVRAGAKTLDTRRSS